jgi:hypothetical protein
MDVTIEPIVWVARHVVPDGTDKPPYDGATTVLKVDDSTVRLIGAVGPWGPEIGTLMTKLSELGFTHVAMTRHGRERRYPLHRLSRHITS